jgi:hypothetical protein
MRPTHNQKICPLQSYGRPLERAAYFATSNYPLKAASSVQKETPKHHRWFQPPAFAKLRSPPTQKSFRMWTVDDRDRVENPDEATAVQLSHSRFLLATTGRNTLTMGTADPLLVVASDHGRGAQLAAVVFAGCQLNWSSPSKAQRLPAVFKRTDEEL